MRSLYTVYTYIDSDSNNDIYVQAVGPMADSSDYEAYVVIGPAEWVLSGGNYFTSGTGSSFSSGPVPAGYTYTAAVSYSVTYSCDDERDGDDDCGYGEDCDDGIDCWVYDDPTGYASIDIPDPPIVVTAIDPTSAYVGDPLSIHITVTGIQSGATVTTDACCIVIGNLQFIIISSPGVQSTETISVTGQILPSQTAGVVNFIVTNPDGDSDSGQFTVLPIPSPPAAPPADPCAVGSDPQVGSTSIMSTGNTGGSGTMSVSFSGAAYAAVTPTVTYGPYSTPSSIAANIAALITKNYYRYGLSAKAFGPNVIYSGLETVGNVTNAATGSSFTTDISSTAATAAENSCDTGTEGNATVVIDNHQPGESYTIYTGGSLSLSATGTPAGGAFSWTSSSSAVSISPTNQSSVTLTGNSAGTASIHVNYTVNQAAADPDGAIVHVLTPAYVTNFQQTTETSANGVLTFTYTWSSSTGNLSDLSGCSVGEYVTYDSNAWPSPPYASAPPNPTTKSVPGTRGQLTDNQDNPGFIKPYAASNFNATQKFRFMCPNYQGGNFVDLESGIVINRVVSQVSGSAWEYTVTKSGQSAQINPLP
jgi:hypothetical protein